MSRLAGVFRTKFGQQFPGCTAIGPQPGLMFPPQRLKAFEAGQAEQAIASGRSQVRTSTGQLHPQGTQLDELSFITRPELDKSVGDEEDRTR